jgi:hypothetical protein
LNKVKESENSKNPKDSEQFDDWDDAKPNKSVKTDAKSSVVI